MIQPETQIFLCKICRWLQCRWLQCRKWPDSIHFALSGYSADSYSAVGYWAAGYSAVGYWAAGYSADILRI